MLNLYSNITNQDLKANNQQINDPIDSSLPIENYFARVDNCIQYVGDFKMHYLVAQVIQKAHPIVLVSGLYFYAWNERREKPVNKQTYIEFNIFLQMNIMTSSSPRSWSQDRRNITARTLWSQLGTKPPRSITLHLTQPWTRSMWNSWRKQLIIWQRLIRYWGTRSKRWPRQTRSWQGKDNTRKIFQQKWKLLLQNWTREGIVGLMVGG